MPLLIILPKLSKWTVVKALDCDLDDQVELVVDHLVNNKTDQAKLQVMRMSYNTKVTNGV